VTLVTKATRGAVAGNGWTNPANATADDSVYATAAPARNGNITGDWDFGAFSDAEIPVGATINSVTLRVQYKVSTTSSIFDITLTRKNGGVSDGTTNDATEPLADTNLDSAFATLPTEAQLKTAGQISVGCDAHRGNSTTAVTASIDYIELQVDYTATILLVGSSAGVGSAAAALTTAITLAGSSAGTATASGVLGTVIALAGSAAGTATAAGLLTTAITLAGSAAGTSTSSAALTTAITLAGSSAGAGSASGTLAGAAGALLVGSSAGTASAAGTLTTLAATAGGSSSASAVLGTAIALAGSSAGMATATGLLTDVNLTVVGGPAPRFSGSTPAPWFSGSTAAPARAAGRHLGPS
jgi:hypothetical protein